jgi:hypothetical protein
VGDAAQGRVLAVAADIQRDTDLGVGQAPGDRHQNLGLACRE